MVNIAFKKAMLKSDANAKKTIDDKIENEGLLDCIVVNKYWHKHSPANHRKLSLPQVKYRVDLNRSHFIP